MSTKAAAANPSLKLHEVLEAEFTQLHGRPPLDATAPLDPEERLRAIWSAVHRLEEKQAALCLSGGGIRSATFALGILHGLARCGLLQGFHYLSTVSGGGYIGGWLAAWIYHSGEGLPGVAARLAQPHRDTRPNPESEEIQNLRSYSNYLSPRLGLLSADSWTLVGTYLRNLLLNWLVILPLLAAALTVPWIYTAVLMMNPPPYSFLPLWFGAVCVVIGVAYMGWNIPCGHNARLSQRRFLLFCLLPLLLASVLMTIFWAWFGYYGRPLIKWPLFGFGAPHSWVPLLYLGIAIHLASYLTSLLPAHGFRFMEFIGIVVSGAVGGLILWLAATQVFPQPLWNAELYTVCGVPIFMALFFLAIMAFAGMSSRWTDDQDREWWGRAAGWLLAVAVGWAVVSGLVVFGPFLLSQSISATTTLATGGAAGAFAVFVGRSGAIPANPGQGDRVGPVAKILSKAASLAAAIFIAVLLILITKLTTATMKFIGTHEHFAWNLQSISHVLKQPVEYLNVILYTPWQAILLLAAVLAACGLGMALAINPNKFSLHAMYRDRLIRAYLGASNPERDANPFTGFDERDNVMMAGLWQRERFGGKLLPLINMALNLVSGSKLAWQERKAENFTVTPLHCGSFGVGYRRTDGPVDHRYGGHDGMSLGTAMTISGAAASPNMGYHSSPLVTFILTLLNVRLGAWLGNPGPRGDDTFHLGYPRFSVGPTIAEAFGLTNDRSSHVYLSDGGHFENLGLYEMVLRRCHYIVVSDAGEDPLCSFADLGGAVRKIRIDFGISIEFDDIPIYPRSDDDARNQKGRNCAIGRILYSEVDGPEAEDGVLIYIKPACYGQEPRDIYEYFKSNQSFPHESTADQFFTESQFESYRMLGEHTMDRLCADCSGDFLEFARHILANHLDRSVPPWLAKLMRSEADENAASTKAEAAPGSSG
jgi:hypothetical protein